MKNDIEESTAQWRNKWKRTYEKGMIKSRKKVPKNGEQSWKKKTKFFSYSLLNLWWVNPYAQKVTTYTICSQSDRVLVDIYL
jgi:hypothetical protein